MNKTENENEAILKQDKHSKVSVLNPKSMEEIFGLSKSSSHCKGDDIRGSIFVCGRTENRKIIFYDAVSLSCEYGNISLGI